MARCQKQSRLFWFFSNMLFNYNTEKPFSVVFIRVDTTNKITACLLWPMGPLMCPSVWRGFWAFHGKHMKRMACNLACWWRHTSDALCRVMSDFFYNWELNHNMISILLTVRVEYLVHNVIIRHTNSQLLLFTISIFQQYLHFINYRDMC